MRTDGGAESGDEGESFERVDHEALLLDMRHELGNASLLLDAAISVLRAGSTGHDDEVTRLLDDVKRRLDTLAR